MLKSFPKILILLAVPLTAQAPTPIGELFASEATPQGPALLEWLCDPDWQNMPLRDETQLTFVLVISTDGGPANAKLCTWEGGLHGCYRVLA